MESYLAIYSVRASQIRNECITFMGIHDSLRFGLKYIQLGLESLDPFARTVSIRLKLELRGMAAFRRE